MRRQRSCAFHAETQEDYIKIAIENQHRENYFYDKCYEKSTLTAGVSDQPQDQEWLQGEFPYISHEADPKFDGFNTLEEMNSFDKVRGRQNSMEPKNSPSIYTVDMIEDCAISIEKQQGQTFVQEKYDFMLIGSPGVGKHALINSQFLDATEFDSAPLRNRLDLVIRRIETPNSEITYNFWIKELLSDAYERLIELYYKKCSAFVFVYDLTSKDSFEKLEKEITAIKKYVGENHFHGILIATQADKLEKRAVAYEEGVALKLKYNLTHFSETNIHIEKEIHQFLQKLNAVSSKAKSA